MSIPVAWAGGGGDVAGAIAPWYWGTMYSVCPQVVQAASRLRSYGTEICSMFAEPLATAKSIC